MKRLMVMMFLTVLIGCKEKEGPYDKNETVVIQGMYKDTVGFLYEHKKIGIWINPPEEWLTDFFGLEPTKIATTDDSGYYRFEFKGGDLMDEEGNTYPLSVMNYNENLPTEPNARCDFHAESTDDTVPLLPLWAGNLSVEIMGDTQATFSWMRFKTTHASEPDSYLFEVKGKTDGMGYNLWREHTGKETTSVDLPFYIFQGELSEKWRVTAFMASFKEKYIYMSASDTTPFPLAPYKLLSSGKDLYYDDKKSKKATDGGWGPEQTLNFESEDIHWIYLDLDTTHTIKAFVVYGLEGQGEPTKPGFYLYVSDDTKSWGIPVDSILENEGYFYIDGFSKEGRYVKLAARAPEKLSISSLREVGVFGD